MEALAEPLIGFATRDAVVARISSAIDFENGDTIRDSAGPGLRLAREKRKDAMERRRKALFDAARRGGRPQVVQGRACLAIRDAGNSDGLVIGRSSDGKEVYVEPRSLVKYNQEVAKAEKDVVQQEKGVCRELSGDLLAIQEDIEKALEAVIWLDAILARVKYGISVNGCTPSIPKEDSMGLRLCLRGLQNPLMIGNQQVLHHNKDQDEEATIGDPFPVPIDVTVKQSVRAVLITGPNTGGKTAALKSIGLAILMAKAGIPIPAREPVLIPWFDEVYADIGDEQSLNSSLSTFSGHVSRIQGIVECCTAESLVLLDELGTGTDPKDGAALGAAIMKNFAGSGPGCASLTIANTHHSELKALKYSDGCFENACVEFDEDKLAPTYQLLWGIPGRSNAVHIAQRLGLDDDILLRANELLGSHRAEINDLIVQLEETRLETREDAAEARRLLEEARRFHKRLQDAEKAVSRNRSEAYLGAAQRVLSEIALARGKIQTTRRKRGRSKVQQTTAVKSRVPEVEPEIHKKSFVPSVGEMVLVRQLGGNPAKVISLSEKKHEATVDAGAFKMTVSFEDITGPAPHQKQASRVPKGKKNLMFERRIS